MTAENFLKSKDYNITDDGELYDGLLTNNVIKDMIEFAQMHVEAALKAANKRVEIHSDSSSNYYREFEEGIRNRTIWVPANSILNAYPKELIK